MTKTGRWEAVIVQTEQRIDITLRNLDTDVIRHYSRQFSDYTDGPKWPGSSEAIGDVFVELTDTYEGV